MDSEKSIKVIVEIVANQAKDALKAIAGETKKTADALTKMGAGAKSGAATIDGSLKTAGGSISGFFNQTTRDFVKGLAVYDLLKKAARATFSAIQEGVQGALGDYRALGQAKAILQSTGLAWDEVGERVEGFAERLHSFGFDVQDTELAVAKFAKLAGGDLTQALDVAKMAADATASGFGTFSENVDSFARILAGRGTREMVKFNAVVRDGATVQEQLTAVQKSLAISVEQGANTIDGKMRVIKTSIDDVKKAVGQGLVIAFDQFLTQSGILNKDLSLNQDSLKAIAKFAYQAANGFIVIFETARLAVTGIRGMTDTLALGVSKLNEWATSAHLAVLKVKNVFTRGASEQIAEAERMLDTAKATSAELGKSIGADMDEASETVDSLKNSFAKLSGEGFEAAAQATEDANTKLSAYRGEASLTADEVDELNKEQKASEQTITKLGEAYGDLSDKQGQFTFEAVGDFARFGTLLADTKTKQDDWAKSVTQGFEAFKNKIKSTNDEIDRLGQKLTDTRTAFADFLKETAQSSSQDFAKIVHDAEQAIPDLQKQLREAGGDSDVSGLQKQLDEKRAIIKSAKKQEFQDNAVFTEELKFLRSLDGKNELEQAVMVTQRKIELKRKETEDEVLQIQVQMALKQAERDAYIEAQATMSAALSQNIAARQKSVAKEVVSMQTLQAAVQQAASAYQMLASQATRALAATTSLSIATAGSTPSKRASGGAVASGQPYLVGEEGPEIFTPSSGGSITPNSKVSAVGGQTIININNPSVRSDADIDSIISGVEDALSRRDELARMGAYK